MANEMYEVELIANPSVRRQMSGNSLKINSAKWRLAGSKPEPVQVKKKDVVLVEKEPKAEPITTPEPSGLLLNLQTEFERLAGKKPKGNWGVKKLSEEIKKLQPE